MHTRGDPRVGLPGAGVGDADLVVPGGEGHGRSLTRYVSSRNARCPSPRRGDSSRATVPQNGRYRPPVGAFAVKGHQPLKLITPRVTSARRYATFVVTGGVK